MKLKPKVLLTGHTGFIGSAIYKALKDEFNVITIGRDSSCNIYCDFSRDNLDVKVPKDTYAIVHAAGLAHGKSKNSKEVSNVNYNSTRCLTDLAIKHEIPRFIFTSSVNVYRWQEKPSKEDSELNESSEFLMQKIKSERYIKNTFRDYERNNFLILRLPLVVGKNPPGNLALILKAMEKGRYVSLRGNHSPRSMVFRSDVINFIVDQLNNPASESSILNLSSGNSLSFNEMERHLSALLGKPLRNVNCRILFHIEKYSRERLHWRLPFLSGIAETRVICDLKAREKYSYNSKQITLKSLKDELY